METGNNVSYQIPKDFFLPLERTCGVIVHRDAFQEITNLGRTAPCDNSSADAHIQPHIAYHGWGNMPAKARSMNGRPHLEGS